MGVLYVASDESGAGKTAFCTTLAHSLKGRGVRATVFKPFAATADAEQDSDSAAFQTLLGQPETAWPFPAPEGKLTAAAVRKINGALKTAPEGQDALIVEESSVLSDEATTRLVELLDAKVVVVVRYRDGLDASALKRWQTLFEDKLVGVVVNGLTRYQSHEAKTGLVASLESDGHNVLGIVPEDRRLLAPTVEQVAAQLEGRFAVGGDLTDGLIEHILVGGLGLDNGVDYFGLRDNKAVVIRGDRPDIQMAALQTPTACMVLTQDTEPIEYVVNEAELEEVPVVVVPTNTLDTMDALGAVQGSVRFDHPAKMERFADLVEAHVDVEAIYGALGVGA